MPSTIVTAVTDATVKNGRATPRTPQPHSRETSSQRATVASMATTTKPTATPVSPHRTVIAVVATVTPSTTTA